jgi:hypothetical protein
MLRVLKPGGTIAFSTWPPELYVGRLFAITAKHLPPPPPGVSPPSAWGEVPVVRERLGSAVRGLTFDRDRILTSALSPQHVRMVIEVAVGPVVGLLQELASKPDVLASFRAEIDAMIADYFDDNHLRQDYLLTRAVKV